MLCKSGARFARKQISAPLEVCIASFSALSVLVILEREVPDWPVRWLESDTEKFPQRMNLGARERTHWLDSFRLVLGLDDAKDLLRKRLGFPLGLHSIVLV